jgi:surface antigen
MVVVIIGVLSAVIPTGPGQANVLGRIFNPMISMTNAKTNATALIAAQAATATAVTVDGYDAGNQNTYAGVQSQFTLPDGTTTDPAAGAPAINSSSGGISSSTGTIDDPTFTNWFTAGQCTYWADYEYHHLTGFAVPWSGNAADWAVNAGAYSADGWVVSNQPRVPSIIVLQPGTQGAGADGHVAVVESINPNGSVHTSNWNVKGWGVFSWVDYSSGYGVQYIYHT